MPEQQKRQTAFKTRVADILNGRYVKEEGWQPNYIVLKNNTRVSRINIMGTILSIQHELNFSTAAMDDGSGIINIRSFEKTNPLQNLKIGEMVQIIGRPREYGSEKYILIGICKKITNPAWLKLRKLELEHQPLQKVQEQKKVEQVKVEHVAVEEHIKEQVGGSENKIIDCVKKLDKGLGADYEDVLKETNNEQTIKKLLQKGEIFEIKPGKLKILE